MYRIVPFTVLCPNCHGKKEVEYPSQLSGNTGTVPLPCHVCKKKGILQTGRVRTDKLDQLYKRIKHKDLICKICHGTGVRPQQNKLPKSIFGVSDSKTCLACRGTRIETYNIILEFRDGKKTIKITLMEYLSKDD